MTDNRDAATVRDVLMEGFRMMDFDDQPFDALAEQMIADLTRAGYQIVPVAREGWQPIETAPRDGTPVLVATDKGIKIAAFRPGWNDFFSVPGNYGIRQISGYLPLPEPPGARPVEGGDG